MPELPESQNNCSIFLPLPPLTCAVPSLESLGSCNDCDRCPQNWRDSRKQLCGTRSVTLQEGQSQARALKWMSLYLLFTMRCHKGLKVLAEFTNYPCFIKTWIKQEFFFFNEKKSEELDKTKKECKSSCTALLSPTVSSITAIPVILSVRKLSLVPSGLSGNYFGHHLWRFLSTVFPDPISFRLLSLLCLTRINTSPRMQKSLFLVGCSTSSVYCFTDTVYDTN